MGDNLATDILFGKNSGIGTVLVLSGLTKADTDHEKISEIQPDFILESFVI